jgi:Ni/Co efflux regulator RcnB
MLKKLVVALIASAFAMGAYAQAQKAEPKGQTGATTQPATPPSTSAKGDVKPEGATKAKRAKSTKSAKPAKSAKASKATDSSKTEAKKESK